MERLDRYIDLTCPACYIAGALQCRVEGQGRQLQVFLMGQTCECDPYHAWEDVWEEAREMLYENGGYD